MYNKPQVILIGSGLGGLSCGAILAKNGYDVLVLEQGKQVGGCLQCFERRGVRFETGMHFVGSAAPGQTLDRLMRYLEIDTQVELCALDSKAYDVVEFNGQCYAFANGREAFVEQLAQQFPHQRKELERYVEIVRSIADASAIHALRHAPSDDSLITAYQLRSVDEVIASVISDPVLQQVLAGILPLYAGEKGKTPFATHAYIMDFFTSGAYRIVGGSDQIAKALVATIERYGGSVLTQQKVTKILTHDSVTKGVMVESGKIYESPVVISDIHPVRTLELTDSPVFRPAFRKRINSLPQTVGCFSVYLQFKENAVPYMNQNYYGYNTGEVWNGEKYTLDDWPRGFLYMHFCHERNPRFAQAGVVLAPMRFDELIPWFGTHVGQRGVDYQQFKHEHAEKLIESLDKHFDGISARIAHYYTSTPLTYLDYTGTEGGSMYGTAKDVQLGVARRIPCRTKVKGLYQTGQNIVFHGMLGVLIGSLVTCSELLDAETLFNEL